MTAQYVVGNFNGTDMGWIDMFPAMNPMETPIVIVRERYDLTPEQARLPINQIKALIAAGFIKRTFVGEPEETGDHDAQG